MKLSSGDSSNIQEGTTFIIVLYVHYIRINSRVQPGSHRIFRILRQYQPTYVYCNPFPI